MITDKLLARLDELEAKEQIREVLYQYCRAVDRGDEALMKRCYHQEGTDDHGFFVGRGREFADYVLPILAELERSIHSLTNPLIELNGDNAYVETQWSVIHRLRRWNKLTDVWHQGRYLDEFERRNGEWRIRKRIAVLDAERWIDTADLQDMVPDSNPNKVYRGQRGRKDPIYRLQNLASLDREAFQLKALWLPLKQALNLPLCLIHWTGALVKRRQHQPRAWEIHE